MRRGAVPVVLALLAACGAGEGEPPPSPDTARAESVSLPVEAAPAPVPLDAEDLAELDARDAADFQQRRRSMESRQACLAELEAVPAETRPKLVEACERLPAAR